MDIFGFTLEEVQFWHWLALSGFFFLIEIMTMSFFFLWLGASAAVIGLIMLGFPDMPWEMQWGLWAMIAVLDIFAWRFYRAKRGAREIPTDEPHLNKRGEQYIGRTLTLHEPIINGFGKVKVDDSLWKAECAEDLPAGSKVRVTALDGTMLKVESQKEGE